MKKAVCAVVLVLALLGVGACGSGEQDWEKPTAWQKGSVFVNGVELEGEYAMIYSEPVSTGEMGRFSWSGTELPFTAILKACGFEVAWTDDFHARMTFRDRRFALDLTTQKVSEENGDDDFIGNLGLGGGCTSCSVGEREIFFDSATTCGFFRELGEDVRIQVDVAGLRVDVTFVL